MKRSIIFASIGIAAGLVLANVYTSLVDVPAWGGDIPASMEVARQYYKFSNPGYFFRIFSPLNQGLGLLGLIFFWRHEKQVRWLLLAALIFYLVGEGMTFMYFYPRNYIMFQSGIADTVTLKDTWEQWRSMNWVRSFVIAAGFVCSSLALHFSFTMAGRKVQQASKAAALTAFEP